MLNIHNPETVSDQLIVANTLPSRNTTLVSKWKEAYLVPIGRLGEDAYSEEAVGQAQEGREEDHVPLVAVLGREVECRDEQEPRQDRPRQDLPVGYLQALDQRQVPTDQI